MLTTTRLSIPNGQTVLTNENIKQWKVAHKRAILHDKKKGMLTSCYVFDSNNCIVNKILSGKRHTAANQEDLKIQNFGYLWSYKAARYVYNNVEILKSTLLLYIIGFL